MAAKKSRNIIMYIFAFQGQLYHSIFFHKTPETELASAVLPYFFSITRSAPTPTRSRGGSVKAHCRISATWWSMILPPGILGSKFVQSALDDCLTTKADVVIVKISEVYNMHSLNILNASYDMWKILKIFAPGRPLGRLGLMQFLQMRWPKIEQSCYFAAISLVMFTMKSLWQNHPKCPSLPGFVVNFLQHPIAPCSAIASQHHSHHRCESDSSLGMETV